MISDETREKWKVKAEAVAKAFKMGVIESTEWERDFVANVYISIAMGKDISFKQSSTLSRLYNKLN